VPVSLAFKALMHGIEGACASEPRFSNLLAILRNLRMVLKRIRFSSNRQYVFSKQFAIIRILIRIFFF